MAATLEWYANVSAVLGNFAALPTPNTIRFKKANDNVIDTNDPVIKPGVGLTNFSWEKALIINVNAGSTYTQLSNLNFYQGGAMPTGLTMIYRTVAQGSYNTAPVDRTTQNAESALPSSPTAWTGAVTMNASTTGLWTTAHAFYVTLMIANSVAGGINTGFNITARYDEIA